jgi:sulfonate dioxygenase
MAPSAVETSVATDQPRVNPGLKLTGGIGPYKELSPIGYEKEAEEKGRGGFEPAKVDKNLSVPNLMYGDG